MVQTLMPGPFAAALVGAGGSLLGGLLGKNKAIPASDQSDGYVEGVMRAAGRFGLNPLTILGAGANGNGIPGDNSSMGAAFADAGMILGDALSKRTDRAKLQQVASQRDQLQKQVNTLTLRPNVPGMYGAPRMGGPNARSGPSPASASADAGRLYDPVSLADGAGGGVATPDPRLDRGSGGYAAGFRWDSAPGWSTGEQFENEYGDTPLSWPYAAAKMSADIGHNAGKWLAMSDRSPIQKSKFKPDGYTEDGYPFWKTPNGVTWNRPAYGQ